MERLLAVGLCFLIMGAHAQTKEKKKPNITKESAKKLKAECPKGDAEACFLYAHYLLEQGTDLYETRETFKKACQLGHREACELVRDSDKFGNQLRQKCEAGDANACVHYADGRLSVYRDLSNFHLYIKKACDLGHQASCQIVKQKKERAREGLDE